jgi:hypothetical protein
MLLIGTLALWIILALAIGIARYRQAGKVTELAFVQITSLSLGVGLAVVQTALPSFWLFVSLALHGGSVRSNLMPGSDVKAILLSAVFGAVVTVGGSVYGCLRIVKAKK